VVVEDVEDHPLARRQRLPQPGMGFAWRVDDPLRVVGPSDAAAKLMRLMTRLAWIRLAVAEKPTRDGV
jgi:hypothetical protein